MSEATKPKRPAFQFYPGDWRKDVELRSCSLAARGLWIDLMCVAHECEPYGYLILNGRPMTPEKLSGQIGVPASQIKRLLDELIENGVARKTEEGAIYSKRMVEDERIRNARAAGGGAGAEHGAKGAKHGIKGGRPPSGRGDTKPPLEPPPSSSSSSSASPIPSEPSGSGAFAPQPPRAGEGSALTDRDLVFANGLTLLTAAGVTDKNARSFLAGQCKAHGDAAVRAAIDRCAIERPVQPVPWLIAALGPATAAARPRRADAVMAGNIAAAQRYLDGVPPQ